MTDTIFGSMIEPENRFREHLREHKGVRHETLRSPLDPAPGSPIQLFLRTGGEVPYGEARCSFTINGSEPEKISSDSVALSFLRTEWDTASWGLNRIWSMTLPPQPAGTLIRYRLAAKEEQTGQWIEADGGEIFSLWVADDPVPDWARSALVYQIFPDRFYPGNGHAWNKTRSLGDIFGGTLRGVIDKLDYIRSLGFNTIWLNPFLKTSSHHGYNASDYYTVEPRLGNESDVKELVEKAHQLGIRMVFDFVANHWSKDHFTFREAQSDPDSKYRDWYTWKSWPHNYECYFNVSELPKINLEHPAAREYMLDVARHWLGMGFDGYRLDFAYGPSHDFWVAFRRACREVKPDCWIFGEVIHTAERLRSYTGIMDGTLDFFLTKALRDAFALEDMSLSEFEAFLSAHEPYFPVEHIRPSFLDNHDEERFLHLAGNDKDRLRLAALVQYALPGPPIVYAGTETGLSQERPMFQDGRNLFEECRLPMNWVSADPDLQAYYRRLNIYRRNHPELIDGDRKVLHLDDKTGTYAFQRSISDKITIIAVNRSRFSNDITIMDPGILKPYDALRAETMELQNNTLHLLLPPLYGTMICDEKRG